MYKEDLALNNLEWLICHKTEARQQTRILIQFVQLFKIMVLYF